MAGRPKGATNLITREVKELAQKYAPDALAELARLATGAESEQARVSAIKEILDRAYGKSTQPIANADKEAFRFELITGVPRAHD